MPEEKLLFLSNERINVITKEKPSAKKGVLPEVKYKRTKSATLSNATNTFKKMLEKINKEQQLTKINVETTIAAKFGLEKFNVNAVFDFILPHVLPYPETKEAIKRKENKMEMITGIKRSPLVNFP